jgi:ABC-type multidrug transport system ATPase subunit
VEEELSNDSPKAMGMTIFLSDAGKRFNREWIFRHLTYTFEEGKSFAITGPNGSGKSTLLQVLSGSMQINEGKIKYDVRTKQYSLRKGVRPGSGMEMSQVIFDMPVEEVYRHVSFCAPYMEVIEEMTLSEFLNFHQGFKPFLEEVSIPEIISIIGLEDASQKQIRYYSSGMRQRVKLAQAIFSDTPSVFLDEPCTNLDAEGIKLYHNLIENYCRKRLVIVSSNDEVEYSFCKEQLSILDFKH